jgi:Tfp pilus assembly protein PilF
MKADFVRVGVVAFAAALLVPATATAQDACGSLENHFGPFDYRTAPADKRKMVESYHFTRDVETLRKGNTSMNIGADISYTLRVFPNHARALNSMANLARRQKTEKPKGSDFTMSCWFQRALQFAPDDPNVRGVYGVQLLREDKPKQALDQFRHAEEGTGGGGNLYYNMGLAYFDLKDYDHARQYAHKAYAKGFTLPGLKEKLQRAGQWKD